MRGRTRWYAVSLWPALILMAGPASTQQQSGVPNSAADVRRTPAPVAQSRPAARLHPASSPASQPTSAPATRPARIEVRVAQIRELRQERNDEAADEVSSALGSLDRRLAGPPPAPNLGVYLALLGTGVHAATQYGMLELDRAEDGRGRALVTMPLYGYARRDPTAGFISPDFFDTNVSNRDEDAFLALLAFEPPPRDARTITLRGKFSLRVPDIVQIQTDNIIGRHGELEHPQLRDIGYTLEVDWYSRPVTKPTGSEDEEEQVMPSDWQGSADHRVKYSLRGDPDRIFDLEPVDEDGAVVQAVLRGVGRGGGQGGDFYFARVPERMMLRITLVRQWQEWPVRFELKDIPLP